MMLSKEEEQAALGEVNPAVEKTAAEIELEAAVDAYNAAMERRAQIQRQWQDSDVEIDAARRRLERAREAVG